MEEASGRTAVPQPGTAPPAPSAAAEVTVLRRGAQGWRVARNGDEELPDLTSAMVLADLLAADHPGAPPGPADTPAAHGPAAGGPEDAAAGQGDPAADAARLRLTVAQLEAALVRRVRVEQAIGIICERRRLPPRKAFELLRTHARTSGTRMADLVAQVVDSATNPLLMLPAELARPLAPPRARGKSPRHVRGTGQTSDRP